MWVVLLARLWQLAAPLLMKINADKCWTGWGARVSAGEERWLSGLTGRLAWSALRCMTQLFASAPYSASVAPWLLLQGGLWRLEQSWGWGSRGSRPRQHVSYQYSTVTSADAALMLQNFSLPLFGSVIALFFWRLWLLLWGCLCMCECFYFFSGFFSVTLSIWMPLNIWGGPLPAAFIYAPLKFNFLTHSYMRFPTNKTYYTTNSYAANINPSARPVALQPVINIQWW